DLPHRERLTDARALALDDDAVEHLDAAACALDHLKVNADGVAGLELRHFAQLCALEILNDVAHEEVGRRPTAKSSVSRTRLATLIRTIQTQRVCVIRSGGQYVKTTLPMRADRATGPHWRESHDFPRLSPIMK